LAIIVLIGWQAGMHTRSFQERGVADRRMFEDIAQQILQLIKDGVFQPGTRLPGERELAGRFGVSRVIIREAEIALQYRRSGYANFINHPCA